MSENEYFSINMRQKVAIYAYLGKIKIHYKMSHFVILKKRGILKESGHPTLVGDMLLKKYNGGKDYARRTAKAEKRATKKRRRKKRKTH